MGIRAGVVSVLVAGALAAGAGGTAAQSAPLVANSVVIEGTTVDVAIAHGAVWALGTRGVAKVDPRTRAVLAKSGGFPTRPRKLAASDSALWVTTEKAVWRVDPATLERTKVADVQRGGEIVARGGTIWYAIHSDQSSFGRRTFASVQRLDESGGAQGPPVALPAIAASLALGPNGLWVGSAANSISNPRPGSAATTTVWKLDAATGAVLATVSPSRDFSTVMHVVPSGGRLWAAAVTGLIEIDAASGRLVRATKDRSFTGAGVAAGPGSLWISVGTNESGEFGYATSPVGVVRYDTETRKVAPGPAGRAVQRAIFDGLDQEWPGELAADADGVWAVRDPGLVHFSGEGPSAPSAAVPGVKDVAVARNRVWALTGRGLQRLDPKTGKPKGRTIRGLRGRALYSAGPWIWLVSADERRARRIDPRTGRVTATARLPRRDPFGSVALTFPSWGIGWWTDRPPSLRGYRPRGGRRLFDRKRIDTAPAVNGPSFAALAAYRGEFWTVGRSRAAQYNARGRLIRSIPAARSLDDVDPRGVAVDRTTIWIADGDENLRRVRKKGGRRPSAPVGPGAYAVATGLGDAWVIADLPGSYSALYRVDGKTGTIEAPAVAVPDTHDGRGIEVRAGQRGRVVVGAGAVWVSRLANPRNPDRRLGRVVRIPLASLL